MSKGLGKLQRCILNILDNWYSPPSSGRHEFYLEIQMEYYDNAIQQDDYGYYYLDDYGKRHEYEDGKAELNRRRASISQSLRLLYYGGYTEKNIFHLGMFCLTDKGKKAITKIK